MYDNGFHFYVDKNGILRRPKDKTNPWKAKSEANPNVVRTKDPDLFYIKRKADGVWFRAKLEACPNQYISSHYYSSFIKERNSEWAVELLGSYQTSGKLIILKTLSKKEKKRLKLP